MERDTLIAKPGMMFTNGKTTGRRVQPAEGENPNDYWPITEEEYFAAMAAERNEEE